MHNYRDAKGNRLCDHVVGPGLLPSFDPCPHHRGLNGLPLELEYLEYSVEWRGLTGHLDGLVTETGRPPFVLAEFKTAASWGYGDFPGFHKIKEPYWKHVEQCNAYATMVEKKGVINPLTKERERYPISSVTVWYMHSDYLNRTPKVWSFKPDPKLFQRHIKTVKRIEQAKQQNKLPRRIKKCSNGKPDPWCDLAPICFSKTLKTELEEALNGKKKRG
jgi:hypothetical protein